MEPRIYRYLAVIQCPHCGQLGWHTMHRLVTELSISWPCGKRLDLTHGYAMPLFERLVLDFENAPEEISMRIYWALPRSAREIVASRKVE
jgi:hypothetical protein